MTVAALPARDEAQEELRRALHDVLAAQRRLRGREARDQHGLTFPQYRLLLALAGADELSAGELAAAADLAPATVTQMLDHLVAEGVVERARSERDRRLVLNRLTPRGRRLQAARRAEIEAKWEAALGDLSTAELREGARLLQRLQRFFDGL